MARGSRSISKPQTAFYAVAVGREPGIYTSWDATFTQIDGFSKAVFRKFKSREEATSYLTSQTKPVPTTASLDFIDVFTDGACLDNGRVNARAGYAVVFPSQPALDLAGRLEGPTQTNNRAEYTAVLAALRQTTRPLRVHTDSKLLIDSMTTWLPSWKRQNWKKAGGGQVLNKDLLQAIDELMATRKVEFVHVPAHTGGSDWKSQWNDVADQRAQSAAKQ